MKAKGFVNGGIYFFLCFFCLFVRGDNLFGEEKIIQFFQNMKYNYQDIIVNNKIIKKGVGPSCRSRYEAVKKVLDNYKRPITVLDIGSAQGYMSFKIAHNYDATCVMISDPKDYDGRVLKLLCQLNTELDNIILLQKRITAEELELLSECEHFDVVLALNVLHHFSENKWKKAANALFNLGDNIIIETPPEEDKRSRGQSLLPEIITFLQEHNGKIISKNKRRHTAPNAYANMYLLSGSENQLKRLNWFGFNSTEYELHSNFTEKFLVKKNEESFDKKFCKYDYEDKINVSKGISLLTFKMLNGEYPFKDSIKLYISKCSSSFDLLPQNIIVQGKKTSFRNAACPKENLETIKLSAMREYINKLIDADDVKELFSISSLIYNIS